MRRGVHEVFRGRIAGPVSAVPARPSRRLIEPLLSACLAVSALWLGLGLTGLACAPLAWITAAGFGLHARTRARPTLRLSMWPFALAAAIALVGAWRIETDPDALIYHLALPQAWAAAHRIIARPEFDAAGFWLGQETFSLVPWLMHLPMATKLVCWGFACLAAAGGGTLAGVWCGEPVRWWAAAAILCSPRFMDLALHAKSDAGAAAFLVGALLVRARRRPRWTLCAGLLLGGAVAWKSTAVVGVPALLLTCVWLPRQRGRAAARILAASALPVLPWMLRNALDLGNPLAPAAVGWIHTLGRDAVNAGLAARYAFTWTDSHATTPAGRLLDLVRIVGGLNVAIAVGFLAALVRPRTLRGREWLAVGCTAIVAGWAVTLGWVARYLAVVIAPMTALAESLLTGWKDGPRRVAVVSMAVGLFTLSSRPELSLVREASPLRTYGDAVTRSAEACGAGGRVLVVGDARAFPAADRLRGQLPEDTPLVWSMARSADGPARFGIRLRQHGFTHLLFNLGQDSFWAEYPAEFPWDARSVAVYRTYWNAHATLLWHSAAFDDAYGYFLLYRLGRRPGEPPSRAWLPGTEGAFYLLRRMMMTVDQAPGLEPEIERLAPIFPGHPEFLARRGTVAAARSDWNRAADDFRAATREAPEAAECWSEWALPVAPADWGDPARLARLLADRLTHHPDSVRACFAMGIPFAFPHPNRATRRYTDSPP